MKKIEKEIKKLKKLFPALFLAKTGLDRQRKRKKKILVPNSVRTRAGLLFPKKKIAKKFKKLKNVIPMLLL